MKRPVSLRGRLVLGLAVLATTAVLAAEIVGFVVMRSWLMDGLDEQLAHFSTPRKAYQDAVSDEGFPDRFTTPGALPSDFRVFFYDSDGRLLSASLGDYHQPTKPELASTVDGLGLSVGQLATVSADTGGGRWRVVLREGPDDMKAVVALPLATIDGATSKILYVDGALLALTVTGVVLLGRWVVRLGLLPLTRMERTAQDITDGDLDLRLPHTDTRTETGRLGRVLNTMLERLQGALRERETSEARLRRFVADAGHELRTPLTAIQGFAELALRHEQQSPAGRREANRLIAQNAERMGLLVDDLQLLAKLDQEPSYGPSHGRESVDLLSLAADAVSAAALGDSGRRIDLGPLRGSRDEEELELVEALGDPHRLRQVVENLLSNARTHTPPGTPVHVRVGTARVAPDTGGADRPGRTSASPPLPHGTPVGILEVADAGPGLAPEDAQRVFERFYRVDRSRSRAHDQGGSGLGLAIAAAIAQGHGGRLELDTAPGEGCTFRLVLPGSGRA
ncbi:HAMP domain-containing histidine kinase [Streptomyces sp. NBC_00554]|uniref:HAMP domain-containing sensor histidine kinase n=1 Tax=unclassified Streptomyces TaxID=2593676 RepID=UPI002E36A7E0|nr:HAMP domain-containing sensor histidine kinase [Streptomyces sp. NBC_01356]WUC50371.1 HAMP domain-containing histidine kinase [Streptomyces sp. NBC_00554]